MAFPSDPLGVTIEAAFGADRTAAAGTWSWTDITDRWHVSTDLRVFVGRRDGSRQAEPGSISLTAKNDDGHLTPEDARSPWWPYVDEGLPLRVTITPGVGDPLVYGGFVSRLTPRWPSGSDRQALVDVAVGGVIRQHGRGQEPLHDPLRRYIRRQGAAGYWLLDDDQDAVEALAELGDDDLIVVQTRTRESTDGLVRVVPLFGRTGLAPWLGGTGAVCEHTEIDLGGGATSKMSPEIEGVVEIGDPTEWAVDWLYRGLPSGAPPALFAGYADPDDGPKLVMDVDSATADEVQIRIFGAGGTTETFGPYADTGLFADDRLHHVRLHHDADGGLLRWALWVDGTQVASDTAASQAPIPLQFIDFFAPDWSPAGTEIVFGHIAVWAGVPPSIDDTVDAAFGHRGETAVARAQRLCGEEGVPVTVVGTGAGSTPMGPQRPGRLLDLLRECEAAEDGILAEDAFGFQFRDRASRYNQTAALTIDAAGRQLGRTFEPTRDDQRSRNRWTIQRTGGGKVIVEDTADQQRRGIREDRLELSLASDPLLADRAQWELSRSTHRGLRYPHLEVPLHAASGLVAAVTGVELGDRVQVENPPTQHPPEPVDQVVEGLQHVVRGRRLWWWQAVVAPAAPWTVGTYAGDAATPDPGAPQRYDTAGSELVEAAESGTDTALLVATTAGPRWTTDSADLPMDVAAAGVRLRVTDVESAVVDSFARTVVDDWGTPDTGPAWVAEGGVDSDYQVAAGVGTHAEQEAGGATRRTLLPVAYTDVEITWSVSIPEVPSGATAQAGLIVREAGSNTDFYIFRCVFLTNGNISLRLSIRDGGAESTLAQLAPAELLSYTADQVVHLRCLAQGSRLLMRGWYDGDPEPDRWQVAAADDTLTGPGRVGLRSGIETGWTGSTPLTFSYHAFEILAPQTFTVQQAPVNGVEKSMPAGSAVSLWTPARYAL